MDKIRAGIVGCGGIANSKHLPSIQKLGEVDVAAFCDLIEERARKAADAYGVPGAIVTADYQELLRADLDIVYVCTPNRSHCAISRAAMKAGKHVLCEKPMALNYEEARAMLATAKETGKVLTIGYQNRFCADSMYLKQECAGGRLGEIYYAKALAVRRRAVPTWGVFLNEEEQGGGPLIDIGTHALDLTLWMMDNYRPKYAVGTTYHKLNGETAPGNAFGPWDPLEFTVEDSAFGFVVMENGASITLEASWALNMLDVHEAKTVLCGVKAGADNLDGVRVNGVRHNRQFVEKPDLGSQGVDYFEGGEDTPSVAEQRAFVRAVRGEGAPVILPEQAAAVTRILGAIYESAKTGAPVYFD